jgi:hypothetical protein
MVVAEVVDLVDALNRLENSEGISRFAAFADVTKATWIASNLDKLILLVCAKLIQSGSCKLIMIVEVFSPHHQLDTRM